MNERIRIRFGSVKLSRAGMNGAPYLRSQQAQVTSCQTSNDRLRRRRPEPLLTPNLPSRSASFLVCRLAGRSFVQTLRIASKRAKVEALAEDILEHGQTTPIRVRLDAKDGAERYVLIEGLHRLEALKSLGETVVSGYLVQARIK